MKAILSLIISGALVVSGYAQTRSVLVNTNSVVIQPTNFWSADASNARTGLGLGTAATNPSSAFQPSSSILTNLASGNGVNLTNLNSSNIVGTVALASNVTGTIAIANGGTGATNAGGARTNLGLGVTNDVEFNTINVRGIFSGTNEIIDIENNFLNYVGFGATFEWQDSANTTYVPLAFGGTNAALNATVTRTNLGLPWSGLTNSNAATFQTALFGSGTNPVLVDTNGSIISPSNFWQVAPITTTFIESQPITNQSTNIEASRFLHIHSLATNISGVTNTLIFPTNGTTFDGDVALVVHKGGTSSVTQVRQVGSTNNLIAINNFNETIEFVYYNNTWQFLETPAFTAPIYFSGTNAATNVVASRINLGLGATNDVVFQSVIFGGSDPITSIDDMGLFLESTNTNTSASAINFVGVASGQMAANTRTNLGLPLSALTNTSNANFRTAIELGATNNVTFSNVTASGALTATGVVTMVTNLNVGGAINVTNKAETRTNLGIGGGITTNLVLKNSANNDTYMNFSNGVLIYGSTTPP